MSKPYELSEDDLKLILAALELMAEIDRENERETDANDAMALVNRLREAMTMIIVYLRNVGDGEDDCWVPCAKCDPGAVEFVALADMTKDNQ